MLSTADNNRKRVQALKNCISEWNEADTVRTQQFFLQTFPDTDGIITFDKKNPLSGNGYYTKIVDSRTKHAAGLATKYALWTSEDAGRIDTAKRHLKDSDKTASMDIDEPEEATLKADPPLPTPPASSGSRSRTGPSVPPPGASPNGFEGRFDDIKTTIAASTGDIKGDISAAAGDIKADMSAAAGDLSKKLDNLTVTQSAAVGDLKGGLSAATAAVSVVETTVSAVQTTVSTTADAVQDVKKVLTKTIAQKDQELAEKQRKRDQTEAKVGKVTQQLNETKKANKAKSKELDQATAKIRRLEGELAQEKARNDRMAVILDRLTSTHERLALSNIVLAGTVRRQKRAREN